MRLYINQIAHYIPEDIVLNSYFKTVNGLDDEWIFSRTGIKTRSKAKAGENTNTMALMAVEKVAGQLPYPIEDVDLIVAATYSPYDTVVTPAHIIQHKYNISNAKCISVSSACSSLINAMEIAEGYFAMGKANKAIIVASEHNTAYANETCPQSGHLWGDGAVAFFISAQPFSANDVQVLDIYTRGLGHLSKAPEAVHLHPQHGGISMPEGRDVFINACNYMVDALVQVTRKHGKTIEDLAFIAPHQANLRIIKNIAHTHNIPEERFLMNIEQRGNTGCPSCAIALSENIRNIRKGDLVGLTVFGGGYSCGAMLLQF